MAKRKLAQDGPVAKRARKGGEKEAVELSPPNGARESVCGEPPAWAECRPDLCDALPWFRSVQGGAYHVGELSFGCLIDADSGSRAHVDDETVITRIGGGCEKDPNGNLILLKDQDDSDRAVASYINSQAVKLPVGLIIGDRNPVLGRQLPHRYNVMGYFRITHIWYEKVGKRTGAKIRFQKLDLVQKSWWAAKGSPDPLPVSEREFLPPESQICPECAVSSPRVYNEGWMCLKPSCSRFWSINGSPPPTDLTYHPRFLSAREPPDEEIRPQYSLVPDLLSTIPEEDVDAGFSRIAWKGIVCPDCHKCISRRFWRGWKCTDPLNTKSSNHTSTSVNSNSPTGSTSPCTFEKMMPMRPVSLRSVVSDFEIGAIQRAVFVNSKLIQPKRDFSGPYAKYTYELKDIGTVTHFVANREVLSQPNGPNDLFEQLQLVDLGLRRYPLQQSVVVGTLTSHFAVNYGMPYKYVVSVDSKGFDEAPPEIMRALGRLTWATEQAVTAAGDEFFPPNELLALAYFEEMSIGYHDDGESSLGPTIATLSLGAKATMKIRLKDKYFRGCTASKKLLTEDIVLPGCEKYDERKELKTKFANKEITEKEYNERRLAIIKSMKRREGSPVISMEIHHGDLVVMHGADMQKYYEHSVIPENKLRFALTSRYIKPDQVEKKDLHKGNFTLGPDEIYHGQ